MDVPLGAAAFRSWKEFQSAMSEPTSRVAYATWPIQLSKQESGW